MITIAIYLNQTRLTMSDKYVNSEQIVTKLKTEHK